MSKSAKQKSNAGTIVSTSGIIQRTLHVWTQYHNSPTREASTVIIFVPTLQKKIEGKKHFECAQDHK